MPIKTKQLKRVFRHGATEYPDVAPSLSPNQVLEVLSVNTPSLTNASIEGPAIELGKEVYTIKVNVGTKG